MHGLLNQVFNCKFTLTQKNHVIARTFGSCYFLSSAVNSLWHKKITWFIPMLFEYLCKSSAQGGLVWMLWSGLVFWLWWGQVWRLWWDVVGVGEEIGVGKETLLPDNHVLCHMSELLLWFYWIFSISAINSVWHKHITWSLGHPNPFPIKIELSCPSGPQPDSMIILAWTLTETGLTEPRL